MRLNVPIIIAIACAAVPPSVVGAFSAYSQVSHPDHKCVDLGMCDFENWCPPDGSPYQCALCFLTTPKQETYCVRDDESACNWQQLAGECGARWIAYCDNFVCTASFQSGTCQRNWCGPPS